MTNNTKILIIEDEILIADFIHKLLMKENFINLEMAHDLSSAETLFHSFLPEIILLDINIEGPDSGIQLSAKKNKDARIIYLTAQNDAETIKKAIATNPDAYLTKPIKKSDLLAAIQLAIYKNAKKEIIIKDGPNSIKLFHDDIIYIKSDNVYIDVITNQRKYTLRNSLDNFFTELNNPDFCKTHRSFIINKKWIVKKTKYSVFLGEIEIPISRNFVVEF